MLNESKIRNFNAKNKVKDNSKRYNTCILNPQEKGMKYKGLKIPKLLLNKKIPNFFNNKNNNISGKKKISSKNFLFLEKPRKNEITNYYYSKNKNLINNISLNSKRKINNLSILERVNHSNYKNKRLKSGVFNMNTNNIRTIKENQKNAMNTSFLSSKPDDPNLKMKLKKYLDEKAIRKENLFLLINNPFNRKKSGKSRLFPHLNRQYIVDEVTKSKKMDYDIYNSIMDEYNKAKSHSNDKIDKNLIWKKLNRNKIGKKVKINKYINKSGEIQKRLLEHQTSLIKRKLNRDFDEQINFDFLSEYSSNVYLSLSNSKDQVYNIRAFGKIMNEGSVIKDLIEEAMDNSKKINTFKY